MKLRIGALTDVGKVRKINEDSFKVFESDEYSYAIVADGMGGHLAGEVASSSGCGRYKQVHIGKSNR